MSTAQLLPVNKQQFYNGNGVPLNGGSLYTYAAGTTTPQAAYTDETAVTPLSNPIVLDTNGCTTAFLRTDLGYKLVLKDSSANQIWTQDNIWIVNPTSIDQTKITSGLAGKGLAQNISTLALDTQVDGSTITINGSNQLNVPVGGIGTSQLATGAVTNTKIASLLEVVYKYVRDLSANNSFIGIPQIEWSAPTFVANPLTLPPSPTTITRWSPTGEFLAVGSSGSTYLTIYQMTGGILTALTVSYSAGIVNDLTWSGCGDFLAVASTGVAGASLVIYQRSGSAFFPVQNPASVPGNDSGSHHPDILNISFSPNSDFLILYYSVLTVGNYLLVYNRGNSSTGNIPGAVTMTGTDLATVGNGGAGSPNYGSGAAVGTISVVSGNTNAVVVPNGATFTDITSTSTLSGIKGPFRWSPDSFLLAVTNISSGNVEIFARANNVFTAIGGITSIAGIDYAFSPDGNFLAVALSSGLTPYISLYQITNGTTFTQLPNPSVLPSGGLGALEWSANSEYLALSCSVTPYVFIYQISGSTFTHITDPVTAPNAMPENLSWSPSKKYLALAVAGTSPYIQIYVTASTMPTNAIVWSRGPNVGSGA
jgi:hypothetical protein